MTFSLVDRPFLMPAQTLYGSTTGPVVDTGQNLKFPGSRVYLSRLEVWQAVRLMPDVVEELAAEMGWVKPEDAAFLRAELAAAGVRIAELEAGQPRVMSLEDVQQAAAEMWGQPALGPPKAAQSASKPKPKAAA